jgi:hypothetical protein
LHAEKQSTRVFKNTSPFLAKFQRYDARLDYGEQDAEPGTKGWDVIYVSEDAKVEKLYAMIEGVSRQQGRNRKYSRQYGAGKKCMATWMQ